MNTKIIGNKIAEARKKLNISQAQLAEHLFISAQAVGKWERGESMPDIVTLNRLAEILNVDLNYFSDNRHSLPTENKSVDSPDKQSTELPPERQGNNLPWDMSYGNWVNADFSGLKNLREKFSSSNMKDCKFVGSELSGLILKNNHVDSCDFTGSDISNSHIQSSSLIKNTLNKSSLADSEFSKSHIEDCNFSEADLTGVKFKSGAFVKNKIANTIWLQTSFLGTQIEDTVFDGTIDDCYFDNCSFKKVTFQNATLTNTFFKCKSLKKIKFIDCQTDRITYEFLKNGKADLKGISLLTT